MMSRREITSAEGGTLSKKSLVSLVSERLCLDDYFPF